MNCETTQSFSPETDFNMSDEEEEEGGGVLEGENYKADL